MFCWGLLAVSLSLLALPWRWLSAVGASGPICAAGRICGWHRINLYASLASPEHLRLREQRATDATTSRIKKLREEGRRPVNIYIGTNDLTDGDIEVLTTLPFASSHTVLVEPQTAVIPKLRERAAGVLPDVEVINAAVCPNNTGDFVMYGFSQRIVKDFPGAANASLSHLTSLKSTWAAKRVRKARRLADHGLDGLTYEQLLSYVEEQRVRCLTPADLLRELGAQAEDVAIFIIDAEGFDHLLVRLFLELPGFRPAYLQLEGGLWSVVLTQELANRGYDVHQYRHDFAAILPAV